MRNGNIPGYADYVDCELDIFADISTRYVSDIQCVLQRVMIENKKVQGGNQSPICSSLLALSKLGNLYINKVRFT